MTRTDVSGRDALKKGAVSGAALAVAGVFAAKPTEGEDMSDSFKEIDPPAWMLKLFASIGALDI